MEFYDIYPDLRYAGRRAYCDSDFEVYRNEIDFDDDTETVIYDYTLKINGRIVREEMTLEEVIDFFYDLGDEMVGEEND